MKILNRRHKALLLIAVLVGMTSATSTIMPVVLPIMILHWHHAYDGGKYVEVDKIVTMVLSNGQVVVEKSLFREGIDGHIAWTPLRYFHVLVNVVTNYVFGSFTNAEKVTYQINEGIGIVSSSLIFVQTCLLIRNRKNNDTANYFFYNYPPRFMMSMWRLIRYPYFPVKSQQFKIVSFWNT